MGKYYIPALVDLISCTSSVKVSYCTSSVKPAMVADDIRVTKDKSKYVLSNSNN